MTQPRKHIYDMAFKYTKNTDLRGLFDRIAPGWNKPPSATKPPASVIAIRRTRGAA